MDGNEESGVGEGKKEKEEGEGPGWGRSSVARGNSKCIQRRKQMLRKTSGESYWGPGGTSKISWAWG